MNAVAVGRPGEVAALSPDVLKYDSTQGTLVAQWAQTKTHKHKMVPFMAGADRHICPITALATAYAAGAFKSQSYDPDGMNFLFPDLTNTPAGAQAASTKITNWIRAFTPASKNVKYKAFKIAELPETVTAGGQRVGGRLHECAANGVSSEFLLFTSGHDADGISTLWHYLGVTVPLCTPGSRVLHGWKPPPLRAAGPSAETRIYPATS